MPKFVTQLLDATGADASEVEFDFESLADAKLETRAALRDGSRRTARRPYEDDQR